MYPCNIVTMYAHSLLVLTLLISILSVRSEKTVLVRCESTAGSWTAEIHPSWSPNGAKRYLDLVEDGFWTNIPLFRAVPGFLVQFGISMDKEKNSKWQETIADDPFPIGQVFLSSVPHHAVVNCPCARPSHQIIRPSTLLYAYCIQCPYVHYAWAPSLHILSYSTSCSLMRTAK